MTSRAEPAGSNSADGKITIAASSPPPIPHITTNYVSLRYLLRALALRSLSELQNMLRTINSLPSDVTRKRELLNVLVACRQEFVRLFVLSKWAAVAPQISLCIDVSAWLQGQHNAFNNAIAALFHLHQGLTAAQQPPADLETALQVLKYGGPARATFGFVTPEPLTNEQVLVTMQRLNVILAVRLAISEQLTSVYRNITIENGRARFSVPGYMWLDVGVANDAVDSQFFYIDFKFDMPNSNISAKLSHRIELIVNDQLARLPLVRVLDWVLEFASHYKLLTTHRQLKSLEKTSWAGVLKHFFNPSQSNLTIKYWTGHVGTHEIVFAIGPNHMIHMKWLIDGKIQPLPDGVPRDVTARKLDIDALLRQITLFHTRQILRPIVDELSWAQQSGDLSILLNFDSSRTAQLTIDHTSGLVVLQSCGPLLQLACKALNEIRDVSKATRILERLRYSAWQDVIAQRAQAAGWETQTSLRMASGEMAKLGPETKVALALRDPSWADGWFITVSLGGEEPRWLATQLVCKLRRWHVNSIHDLGITNRDPAYKLFSTLSPFCNRQFALYELCQDLDAQNVRHAPGKSKSELYIDLQSLMPTCESWAYTGLVVTVVDNLVCISGMSRDNSLAGLGSLDEDGLEIDKEGKFMIKASKDGVLPQLLEKLQILDRLAGSLMLAKDFGLKVLTAKLHEVRLDYGNDDDGNRDESILTIKDKEASLDPANPQYSISPFLSLLLQNDGLGSVIELLRLLNPVFQILKDNEAVVIPRSASVMVVQTSYSLDNTFRLELQLRKWDTLPVLYITAEPPTSELDKIKEAFTTPLLEGVVPLRRGLAVKVEHSAPLLRSLLKAMKA